MEDTTETKFTFSTPFGNINVTAETQDQAEVQLEFVLIEFKAAQVAIMAAMKDNRAEISWDNEYLKGDAPWMN